MKMAWMVILLLASVSDGQVNLTPNLIDPERDDCIQAAICNLIKGDLMIETQGEPGQYYELAMKNLGKSMKYKQCGLESIFTHCSQRRLECEADINQLARNYLQIPIDMLTACPYETWPYMLFNCKNYRNWPDKATEMIAEVCRSCLTQCYMIEEFEAFQRSEGLTDFPANWETLKNLSKIIKSQSVERRQGGSFVYPWGGLTTRSLDDVSESRISRDLEKHGQKQQNILCPPDHFIDVIEEFRDNTTADFGLLSYLKLRFGCTKFGLARKDPTKQLWTGNELGGGSGAGKTTDCFISGTNRFIVRIKTSSVINPPNNQIWNWEFTCGSGEEVPKDPVACPRYTAVCSVAVYLYPATVPAIHSLAYDCCKVPGVVKECNDKPKFLIERIDNVQCLTKGELKNCSYNSNFGLIVNGKVDTDEISSSEALQQANIFQRMMTGYGVINMKMRNRFKWINVPQMTNQLANHQEHHEVVLSTREFTRWQPMITCGKYRINSANHIKHFVNTTNNPTMEYLNLVDEFCTPGFHAINNRECAKAFTCKFTTKAKPKCELCNVTFEYGIIPTDKKISSVEASKLFKHILNSYRFGDAPDDAHEWVNVPEKDFKNNISYIVPNIEGQIVDITAQPQITCKSGTIIARNRIERKTFDGNKFITRYFKAGFIDRMMEMLACMPIYEEVEIKNGKLCTDSPGILNGRLACSFTQTFGFEVGPSVQETTEASKLKLIQIADIAKTMRNNARLFDWAASAATSKMGVKIPEISVLQEKYAIDMLVSIITVNPTITCGDYKLYANYVKDIGCSPILRTEPYLPVCTGCTINPNFNSLPRMDYKLYYLGCPTSSQCTWTLESGFRAGLGTDQFEPGEKLDILVSLAPPFTSDDHQEPGEPFDWAGDAKTKLTTYSKIGNNGFDRVYQVPTIECGKIKIYSKKITFRLVKDL